MGSADRSGAVPALRLARHARDEAGAGSTPAAGQPGHGLTAGLRRRPVGLVGGRVKGGYAGAFEVICGDGGDHRYLDYPQLPPRLRRLRGPCPLDAGVEACGHHIGLVT
jgi:hypothetical protein